MLVELTECVFGYGGRAVVKADAMKLRAGQCLGIFGPNGSGKTTLVRGVTGLLPPMSGAIRRDGAIRFGYLPQHRAMELHWPMSGLDAASLFLSARRPLGWMRGRSQQLRPMLEALGVENLVRHSFAKLSGGQQQRLLLAGALAAEPQVLVLDEPTDGLDVRSRQVLLDVLGNASERGLCTVIISHDVEDLLSLCDEVAWLHRGDAESTSDEPSSVELIEPASLLPRVAAASKTAPVSQ